MKYKCLVFDHDNTVVNSTVDIHYPCFVEYAKKHRPNLHISLHDYFIYSFNPGVVNFYKDICGLNEQEFKEEYQFWLDYCHNHVATAFDGIKEIMEEHKRNGGLLAVVSNSQSDNILKDYRYNNLPLPDDIYDINRPKKEIKPSPIPLFKIMEKYHLQPSDLLVIDDLKHGLDMAKAAKVPFCAAGWSFDIPENTKYLKENADFYCQSVNELKNICFPQK